MSAKPKVTVQPEALQQFVNYYFDTCEKYRVTPRTELVNVVQSAASDPRKLKLISLRKLGLRDPDVFAIAEVLSKFYIIRELDLRDNAITDDGVEALLVTARSQLATALKDRLPPSGFKPSYLLSAVRLIGNRINNPGAVANLNAHLQLLLKEQLKIVAHHVRDHVRQQSLQNPANTDPTTIQLTDLKSSLRSLSLPGSVTPRVSSAVQQRGGRIDHASFVDLVHSELLSQNKLNKVDPRQAEILQQIAAQSDGSDDDDDGSVLSRMSSISDSSHNTASVFTGAGQKKAGSGKRKKSRGPPSDSGSESMPLTMSMSMSMGSMDLDSDDEISSGDDDDESGDLGSGSGDGSMSMSLSLGGSSDLEGGSDDDDSGMGSDGDGDGDGGDDARSNLDRSRAMSLDDLAASRRRASVGRGDDGQGLGFVNSMRPGAMNSSSPDDAPFKLEVALIDITLVPAAAAAAAERVSVTFEFDGDSQQVSHSFLQRKQKAPQAEFQTSLADLAAAGKAHDAATLQGVVWSRTSAVGSFKLEVRPLARAWALKQGGAACALQVQRRLTIFQNENGTEPVGNIELGLLFEPNEADPAFAETAGDPYGDSGMGQSYNNGGAFDGGVNDHVDLELNLSSRRIYSLAETGFNWEPLLQIRSLDLSNNQFAVLSPQTLTSPPLRALRHLNLSRNNIERIAADAFGSMTQLEKLDLSHNRISKCQGFAQLLSLKELNLAHNRIRIVGGLHAAQQLLRLDLSYNKIQSAIALRAVSLNTKLDTLIVEGNPMATANRLYRASIIGLLPSLSILDGKPMPRNSFKYKAMQKAAKKVAEQQVHMPFRRVILQQVTCQRSSDLVCVFFSFFVHAGCRGSGAATQAPRWRLVSEPWLPSFDHEPAPVCADIQHELVQGRAQD